MTTLAKIIVATLLSLSLFSCNFDMNMNSDIKGNGIVTIEKRTINLPFSSMEATKGLEVYLTQSDTESIRVETDENLQNLIIVEVINDVLKIHTKQTIGKCKSKKVMVSFKNISFIKATSGSDVYSTNTINSEHLDLETTSGSNMRLAINTLSLNCKSTSGSNLHVSGKTNQLLAEAASGSDIEAAHLITQISNIKATSGADITSNVTKELIADTSSGGDIKYTGNPEIVNTKERSSGSVKKL